MLRVFKYNSNIALKTNYFYLPFNNFNKFSVNNNIKSSIFLKKSFDNNSIFKFKNSYRNFCLKYIFKFNGFYFHIFDVNQKKNWNNFFIFLNSFLKKKEGFLIIDSNYKSILPLYNFIYKNKNLYSEKSFFFLNKKAITYPTWTYLYKNFLSTNNIKVLFFLDYLNYVKFFKLFTKFNVALISLLPQNYSSAYLDFYVHVNYYNLEFNKLLFLNYFNFIYFQNYNKDLKFLKLSFILKFKTFSIN